MSRRGGGVALLAEDPPGLFAVAACIRMAAAVLFPRCFPSPCEPVLILPMLSYVGHLTQSCFPLSWKERICDYSTE